MQLLLEQPPSEGQGEASPPLFFLQERPETLERQFETNTDEQEVFDRIKRGQKSMIRLKPSAEAYLLDEQTVYIKTERRDYVFNDTAGRFIGEILSKKPKRIEETKSINEFRFRVQAFVLKDWLIRQEIFIEEESVTEDHSAVTIFNGEGAEEIAKRRARVVIQGQDRSKGIVVEMISKRKTGEEERNSFAEVLATSLRDETNSRYPISKKIKAASVRVIATEARAENAIFDKTIAIEGDEVCVPVTLGEGLIEIGPVFGRKTRESYDILNQRALIKAGATHEISGGLPFIASPRFPTGGSVGKGIGRLIAYILDREFDEDPSEYVDDRVWTAPLEVVQNPEDPRLDLCRVARVHRLREDLDKMISLDDEGIKRSAIFSRLEILKGEERVLRVPIQNNLKQVRTQKIASGADGGHRLRECSETRSILLPFVDQSTGILDKIDLTALSKDIFMYSANRVLGSTTINPRNKSETARATGYPISAAGKGRTTEQAQVSCIAEAIERYSANHPVLRLPTVKGRYNEFQDQCLDPNDILLYSERQYGNREIINQSTSALIHKVPKPFNKEKDAMWSPVVNILDPDKSKLLPTAMLGFNYTLNLQPGTAMSCSNGLASGNSKSEAMIQALYEIIERDSCAIWWYNRLKVKRVAIPEKIRPYVSKIKCELKEEGRDLEILELPSDFEVHVSCCVSKDKNGRRICVGLGSHADKSVSIIRAVTEMYQMLVGINRYQDMSQLSGVGNGGIDGLVRDWLIKEKIDDHEYLVADEEQTADHGDALTFEYIEEELDWLLQQFKQKKIDVYAINMTSDSIGFPVVKVFAPSMRHFWPRFGDGRIFDLPVDLGYADVRKTEDEMNNLGFFF